MTYVLIKRSYGRTRRIRARWTKKPHVGMVLWLHPKRWPPLWEARELLRDGDKLGRQGPKIEVF